MAIAGNPKKLAQDLAGGFLSLSPPILKQYTAADLKTILVHIGIVARGLRSEPIAGDDAPALKARNLKLTRLNQAELIIRAHGEKQRIPL